jgi:hypothetical protein
MSIEIEIEFLIPYYQSKLQFFKQLNLDNSTKDELLKYGEEASSLRKIMADYQEEGYDEVFKALSIKINPFEFLQTFIQDILKRLKETSEQAVFYLLPQIVQPNCLNDISFATDNTQELNTFLAEINQQVLDMPDIRASFSSSQQMALWQGNTKIIMHEQTAFLSWCVKKIRQQPNVTPIFLLRDTLLPYLGYLWLRQHHPDLPEAKPLLLSRKFLSSQTGNEDFYFDLGYIIYSFLTEKPQADFATLCHDFAQDALTHPNLPQQFLQSSRDYLASLQLTKPVFIVETGLHGTFPLWLLTLTQNHGDFVLYATAPWLKACYLDRVFCKNYNYMRDMETIIIHEYLFRFHRFSEGQVFIAPTSNPHIKALTLYELASFKQQMQAKFSELSQLSK